MAQTYYYCDGNLKKSTSVSMSSSSIYTRTYTIGDNTDVIEKYKNLTFIFSPTVSFGVVGGLQFGLKVKYSYQFRTSLNYSPLTSWTTTESNFLVPNNTTTKVIEVLISREVCEWSTSGGAVVV